jgi:hypothetical protein
MDKTILAAQDDINRILSMHAETIETGLKLTPERTYSAPEVLEFIAAERERCAKIVDGSARGCAEVGQVANSITLAQIAEKVRSGE